MRKRSLIYLLVISLMGNSLLLGHQAVRYWWPVESSHHSVMVARLQGLSELLPKTAQPQLILEVKKRESAIHQNMRHMQKTRHLIHTLLQADPLDSNKLGAALKQLREDHNKTQALYHDALLAATQQLSLQQRQEAAKKLKELHHDAITLKEKENKIKD